MNLEDLVRQVPAWALWLEVVVGTIGLLAVAERLRMGRTPLLMTLLGASCLAFGSCGLALRMLDPSVRSPVDRVLQAPLASASPPAEPTTLDP